MNQPEQLKHNITEDALKNGDKVRALHIRRHHESTACHQIALRTDADIYKQPNANGTVSRGPSPNRGASMPDVEAQGTDSESKREWQKKRGIDTSKQVRLVKLSHMRYQHPDLNKATTFLRGEQSLPFARNGTFPVPARAEHLSPWPCVVLFRKGMVC